MRGFNEGGADCPPKHRRAPVRAQRGSRFNEGGADCPPKRTYLLLPYHWIPASMKGGRTAPRNLRDEPSTSYASPRFNEGGADCPPKQVCQPLDFVALG